MILRNERNEPPGGWRYKQEETGLQLMERTLPDLCRKIREHRRYKDLKGSLDLNEISIEVQRQICANMNDSPVFCRPEIGFITQTPVSETDEFEFQESNPVVMPEAFQAKQKAPEPEAKEPEVETPEEVKPAKKIARKRRGRKQQQQD